MCRPSCCCPDELDEADTIAEWLRQAKGKKVELTCRSAARSGGSWSWPTKNARDTLEQQKAEWAADSEKAGEAALAASGGARAASAAAPHRVLRHLARPGHEPGGEHGRVRGRQGEAVGLQAVQDQAPGREQRLPEHAGGGAAAVYPGAGGDAGHREDGCAAGGGRVRGDGTGRTRPTCRSSRTRTREKPHPSPLPVRGEGRRSEPAGRTLNRAPV